MCDKFYIYLFKPLFQNNQHPDKQNDIKGELQCLGFSILRMFWHTRQNNIRECSRKYHVLSENCCPDIKILYRIRSHKSY